MKKNYSKSGRANLLLVVFVLVSVSLGCKMAKGKIVQHSCDSEVGFINGELDYGVTAKVRVKNVGEAGEIKVFTEISTSEGKWTKKQSLYFERGEEKNLSYFFHEPTVGVRNVQCMVGVSPDAE